MSAIPDIGALLIGDELLSGKRRDKHMPALIDILAARGLELSWLSFISDDAERLQASLARSLAGSDIVFSFGGIGATPDDRTRQCAAAAAGRALEINAEGRALLEARFGEDAYPQRIQMVEWPVGATVIPNPVNQVPGFSLDDHHFVPGFPNMAWPMIEWVLDHRYGHLLGQGPLIEHLIEVRDTPESALIPTLESVMGDHPEVRVACLPSASGQRVVELGVKGRAGAADNAFRALHRALVAAGFPLGPQTTR